MKKIGLVFVTLCFLLVSLVGCSGGSGASVLREKGLALTVQMDALAQSESYRTSMTAAQELQSIIATMGEQDYAAPKKVFQIVLPKEALSAMLSQLIKESIPDELQQYLNMRLTSGLPSQLNATYGVSTLAAASSVTVSHVFVCKDVSDITAYLYQYDGEYGSMVVFCPGEDGAVSATASFVRMEMFPGSTPEEIASVFEQALGITGVVVTEVPSK